MNHDNFSPEQIKTLRDRFGAIQTVNPDHLDEFRVMFDGCSNAALRQLALAGVKFISKLAVNACIRRGLKLRDAEQIRDTEQRVLTCGNRAVLINRQGKSIWANLYVNVRVGLDGADITTCRWEGKTMAGAVRWAGKQFA